MKLPYNFVPFQLSSLFSTGPDFCDEARTSIGVSFCCCFFGDQLSTLSLVTMGIGNILALSQVTGYVLSTILFFFIIWPMSNNLRSFNGNCILFSSGQYDIKDQKFEVTDWAYGSSCAFVIFLSLLIVFISIWQTIRISIHLVKNTDRYSNKYNCFNVCVFLHVFTCIEEPCQLLFAYWLVQAVNE